ncbi:MAG: esterase/lipase family protein [Solirubrobacteraceae bacterium]
MRSDEVRALGALAGGAAGSIASQARDVHASVAGRVFGLLGPAATATRVVHDQITERAYRGARALTGAVVAGPAYAYGLTRRDDAAALEANPRARLALGALNGAFGDMLERTGNPLAMPMTVRRRGQPLDLDRDSLAAAIAEPRSRVAIFLHGLGETEDAWRLRAERHQPYGERLEAELAYTSLYVRYNSGRHVSHNGRRLAECLDELTAGWPVPITEIALVGHSMGGLVARAACYYGAEKGWVRSVRDVVMLGTPHRGAPLELAANAATAAISLLPEVRPFAGSLRARSAGVKDLGYGYVVDQDWDGHDPDRFWTNTGTDIPFLESADHYFVSATVTRDAEAPLGRLFGDLLVRRSSAWSHGGRGERMRFPLDRYRHLGGATHFDLLNHPAVYELIEGWLTRGRPALPAPA